MELAASIEASMSCLFALRALEGDLKQSVIDGVRFCVGARRARFMVAAAYSTIQCEGIYEDLSSAAGRDESSAISITPASAPA